MMTRFKLLAALLLVGPGAGWAAPTTYDIDQAFWGAFQLPLSASAPQSPADFQTQRAADVAADPSAFGFLTGQITVDWDSDTLIDLGLTMTAPGGFSAGFGLAEVQSVTHANQGSRFTNLVQPVEEFRMALGAASGPTLSFDNDFGPVEELSQFFASLDFTLTRVLGDGSLNMTLSNGLFQEAVQSTVVVVTDPLCNPLQTFTCVGDIRNAGGTYSTRAQLPYTETYGAAGITVSEVPLPAGAILLLSAVAVARRFA